MKEGISLQALVDNVKSQALQARDFIAPTQELSFESFGAEQPPHLRVNQHGLFKIADLTHNQISDALEIPTRFYNRLLTNHPDVLVATVNPLFQREPKVRMVRAFASNDGAYGEPVFGDAFNGIARAFVSDRYQRRDNLDLLTATLPALQANNLTIRSANVSDRKLHIKAVATLEGEVRKGDPIRLGVAISNSEVGMGSTSIEPFIERLVCLNGAVIREFSTRKAHLGGRIDSEDAAYELLTDEALQADDTAFWLAFRDVMAGLLTPEFFEKILAEARAAADRKLDSFSDAPRVVEVLAQNYGLLESEKMSVLDRFLEGADYTQYGLANAITGASQVIESYDRATEFEALGGKVITLGPNEWRHLAESTPKKVKAARG